VREFLGYFLLISLLKETYGAATTDHTLISLERPYHKVFFKVENADTPSTLKSGLMNRHSIAKNSGMLFIFPIPQIVSFWMKDTLIPLDLIFIKENGKVVQFYFNAQPLTLDIISCKIPVKYVLEVPAGSIQDHNIQLGDSLVQQKRSNHS
jgi:uncharacterized membrane protein (UPF0127 family)